MIGASYFIGRCCLAINKKTLLVTVRFFSSLTLNYFAAGAAGAAGANFCAKSAPSFCNLATAACSFSTLAW